MVGATIAAGFSVGATAGVHRPRGPSSELAQQAVHPLASAYIVAPPPPDELTEKRESNSLHAVAELWALKSCPSQCIWCNATATIDTQRAQLDPFDH